MFKISDFSKFSRVSIKMLRHYDQIGLLTPTYVDPATKYRYYSAEQLPRLNRIIALKDLGFSLEQIAHLLDSDLSGDQLRGMLKLRREEIKQNLTEEEAKLAQVEARIKQIDLESGAPPYEVLLRKVEPQRVATIREVVSRGEHVSDLFEKIETYVAQFGARAVMPPLLIYHDTEYDEQKQDIEVVIPISADIPATDRVNVYELEGSVTTACVVHIGSYESMGQAFNLLLRWIEDNGYEIAGAMREVYLRFGANNIGYRLPDAYLANSTAEFVTELQLPVSKQKE
jgi:DNA-binding transcriptional MerR regulator